MEAQRRSDLRVLADHALEYSMAAWKKGPLLRGCGWSDSFLWSNHVEQSRRRAAATEIRHNLKVAIAVPPLEITTLRDLRSPVGGLQVTE